MTEGSIREGRAFFICTVPAKPGEVRSAAREYYSTPGAARG
jgi:hypothetical protein